MKSLHHGGVALRLAICIVAWSAATLWAQTAAELIEQARRYDCGYSAGPDASQVRARDLYQQALAADPDPQQRLHILFRLGQLHSSAYQASNGEKPDYPQAIAFYERIIATCPPQEPLVIRSMAALADCLIIQGRFVDALHWSKKVLEVDPKPWQDRLQALETPRPEHTPDAARSTPPADPYPLRQTLRQIELAQRGAVDQVANAALGLGPVWVESQLQSLVRRYPGTGIEKRARELLHRYANVIHDGLAPNEHLPLTSETSVLQSAGPVNSSTPDSNGAGLSLSATAQAPPPGGWAVGSGQTAGTPQEQNPSRSPRGPPRRHSWHIIVCAAGLVLLLVLAARGLLRRSVRKGIRI
jgi:hypothetical protein